jgi:hypothetical protein
MGRRATRAFGKRRGGGGLVVTGRVQWGRGVKPPPSKKDQEKAADQADLVAAQRAAVKQGAQKVSAARGKRKPKAKSVSTLQTDKLRQGKISTSRSLPKPKTKTKRSVIVHKRKVSPGDVRKLAKRPSVDVKVLEPDISPGEAAKVLQVGGKGQVSAERRQKASEAMKEAKERAEEEKKRAEEEAVARGETPGWEEQDVELPEAESLLKYGQGVGVPVLGVEVDPEVLSDPESKLRSDGYATYRIARVYVPSDVYGYKVQMGESVKDSRIKIVKVIEDKDGPPPMQDGGRAWVEVMVPAEPGYRTQFHSGSDAEAKFVYESDSGNVQGVGDVAKGNGDDREPKDTVGNGNGNGNGNGAVKAASSVPLIVGGIALAGVVGALVLLASRKG